MNNLIAKLKTPDECATFAKNATDRGHPEYVIPARLRALQLRAEKYGVVSEVEMECIKAIYAYEDVMSDKAGCRIRASRS